MDIKLNQPTFVEVDSGENSLNFNVISTTPTGKVTHTVTFKHHLNYRNRNSDPCTCDNRWTEKVHQVLNDSRCDLDSVNAERTVSIRERILSLVPQFKGNIHQPVCCIPKFLKRENELNSVIKGTLFVCACAHGETSIFGCFLVDLCNAANIAESTGRSRLNAVVKDLGLSMDCCFPKDEKGRRVVPIDMIPEILRASEDTNFGTTDLVLNAIRYYEKYYVNGKQFDLNTVRFVILAFKGDCIFTTMSKSFARIAREQQVQHNLYETMTKRINELEKTVMAMKWQFWTMENKRREHMASEANLSARVANNADLLCLILNRIDDGYRTSIFDQNGPLVQEMRQKVKLADLAKEAFQEYFSDSDSEPEPSAITKRITKAVKEIAELPQDKRLEDDLEHATDDEWVLQNPNGSSASSYNKNTKKVAKALKRPHAQITDGEKELFDLRDQQCRDAHRRASEDLAEEENQRKRQKPLNT